MAVAPWETIDDFLIARGVRIGKPTLGQTIGGGHAPNSAHYQFRARDYGNKDSDVRAVTAAVLPAAGPGGVVSELYDGISGVFMRNGAKCEVVPGHNDHVHVALYVGKAMDATSAPIVSTGQPAGDQTPWDEILSQETAVRIAKVSIGVGLIVVSIAGAA